MACKTEQTAAAAAPRIDPEMTVVLLIAIVTTLTAWLISRSTHRWTIEASSLGLMSLRWLAEHRDDDSRHGPG